MTLCTGTDFYNTDDAQASMYRHASDKLDFFRSTVLGTLRCKWQKTMRRASLANLSRLVYM